MPNETQRLNLEAIKTLVALHGPTEAARMTGLKIETVKTWTKRYRWPNPRSRWKGAPKKEASPMIQEHHLLVNPSQTLSLKSPSELVQNEMEANRETSKLHLSRYLAKAAVKTAEHPRPLDITKKAKEVSDTLRNVFPEEKQNQSLTFQFAVITGAQPPEKIIDAAE